MLPSGAFLILSMMKRLFIFVVFVFISLKSICQVTFNLRERYDFLACVLTSVVPTDSCYYLTGVIADTIFPYNTGAVFLKLDLDGNMQMLKSIKSTLKSYELWSNSLSILPDGNFLNVGYNRDSIYTGFLVKFDKFGDTIFVKEYRNPNYPTGAASI